MKLARTDGVAPLVARLLFSVLFLINGIGKITDWNGAAGFMASHGMPLVPIFLAGAIVLEVGCGAMLLLGYKTRLAALALFLYLIPVTLVFHDFWSMAGAERMTQMISFLKNAAIMGGLAEVFAFGAGRISVDNRVRRPSRQTRFETPAPHQPAHA